MSVCMYVCMDVSIVSAAVFARKLLASSHSRSPDAEADTSHAPCLIAGGGKRVVDSSSASANAGGVPQRRDRWPHRVIQRWAVAGIAPAVRRELRLARPRPPRSPDEDMAMAKPGDGNGQAVTWQWPGRDMAMAAVTWQWPGRDMAMARP